MARNRGVSVFALTQDTLVLVVSVVRTFETGCRSVQLTVRSRAAGNHCPEK
jgi:hypothetical protein